MIQHCRFCSSPLHHTFCDLGKTPPSNSYLKKPTDREYFFPLHALVCDQCLLVQLGQFQTPDEIFSDYAYFSSYSESWIAHGKKYTDLVSQRFSLGQSNFVVEIASNDGYLLQHFKEKEIPILGIEPAKNVAQVAIGRGIPTLTEFFGKQTAQEVASEKGKADLIIGNNVLAHVPDLNDFVSGLKLLLKNTGLITLEFPHLLQLIHQNQFDTIYHEHFSYFSLVAAEKVFNHHGLELFDVEEIPTHGGSLRVYLQHSKGPHRTSEAIEKLLIKEKENGLGRLETYTRFSEQVQKYKKSVLSFFKKVQKEGKIVAAYGAPAKGNTLLNYCEITTDLLPFTVDKSPHKQGHFLPGTHIPIFAPVKIEEIKPDYLFLLPWNLKTEIMNQMAYIRNWGGKFVIPIPEVSVIE
jgi:SAM-dependent methyltransferase